jgi:D-glycero-D-manno-heptose 1,7-bisphosphate phosphatase
MTRRKAVFLDRDGTLIEERGYISHCSQTHLLHRAAEAVLALNQSRFLAVMVSNQSGVARGYFPESALHEIHQHIELLLAGGGAHLDGIYYCPHFPEGTVPQYRMQCRCRKPETGMVEQACRELPIEIRGSYVIGDKLTDMEMARRSGLIGILVLTGYGAREWERHLTEGSGPEPSRVCEDIGAAVDWIMERENLPR